MGQNNFMYEWKKAKEHYDTLSDGSIQIHDDAPDIVKESYQEYERIMGKVVNFPKKRSSLFNFSSKSDKSNDVKRQPTKIRKDEPSNQNVKAIFDMEEKKHITDSILTSLPDCFNSESMITKYIDNSASMPYWAVYDNGPVGFIAIKKHNQDSAEIYVMSVLRAHQRKHIGYHLLRECEKWCRSDGIKYLQVKIISDNCDNEFYTQAKAFYDAVGFFALEKFTALGDEHIPCLLMVKKL